MEKTIFRQEDGIREAECISILDNSIDFYIAVLNSFLKEARKAEENLSNCLRENNQEGYRIIAHGLKSSAASAGFMHISESAKIMEKYCKTDDFKSVIELHEDFCIKLKSAINLIDLRIHEYEEMKNE